MNRESARVSASTSKATPKGGIAVCFAPRVEAFHHAGSSRMSPIRIEWYKTRGFLRCFRVHYRGLRWIPVTALLRAGVLIRFGIKVVRCLLWSASCRRVVLREAQALSSAGELAPVEGRASKAESTIRS